MFSLVIVGEKWAPSRGDSCLTASVSTCSALVSSCSALVSWCSVLVTGCLLVTSAGLVIGVIWWEGVNGYSTTIGSGRSASVPN